MGCRGRHNGCHCRQCSLHVERTAVRNAIWKEQEKPKTVFDAIAYWGHDEDFIPARKGTPTDAAPGTPEKIEILRQRLADGEELFQKGDRWHYDGTSPGIISAYGRIHPCDKIRVFGFDRSQKNKGGHNAY